MEERARRKKVGAPPFIMHQHRKREEEREIEREETI
jgi:hypothetical protein